MFRFDPDQSTVWTSTLDSQSAALHARNMTVFGREYHVDFAGGSRIFHTRLTSLRLMTK